MLNDSLRSFTKSDRSQERGKRWHREKCIYCQEEYSSRIGDHLPPQGYFPKNRYDATNFITVPACEGCNRSFSDDDNKFIRDLTLKEPGPIRLENDEVIDRVGRGIDRKFALGVRHEKHVSPGMIVLFEQMTYKPDVHALVNVTCRIVKGLYYHRFKIPVPLNTYVQTCPVEILCRSYPELYERFNIYFSERKPISNCDGRFQYKMGQISDVHYWYLEFHPAGVGFVGIVNLSEKRSHTTEIDSTLPACSNA
ncbi:hypothetical protein KIH39_22550 [Telmatocola sphagniphila]|uniref:HNH endonuclease 5 domain-containing protein n=1 Tax=Telmatocola sphagniphila TaxID=1123043 RepID=A0A8E6ESY1_9BACT|nr:hypothetical protein [Telmatocola sphagniphila]QVL31594.1 hypothetical protein KIH39_22550 [Telmatocola sphagniphila]